MNNCVAEKCPQESRIRILEDHKLQSEEKFENLLSRFDGLIAILRKLAFIGISIVITVLGVLISYWVKG